MSIFPTLTGNVRNHRLSYIHCYISIDKHNFVQSPHRYNVPDKHCVMCETVLNDVNFVLNMVDNICDQIL